jgi:hypothetical protein
LLWGQGATSQGSRGFEADFLQPTASIDAKSRVFQIRIIEGKPMGCLDHHSGPDDHEGQHDLGNLISSLNVLSVKPAGVVCAAQEWVYATIKNERGRRALEVKCG